MVERIKDQEDRLLESLFDSAPIADDGFSAVVVKKVRRKLWLRRLAVPVAAIVGGAIAIRPLSELVTAVASLTSMLPQELVSSVAAFIPQTQSIVLGALLLVVCMLGLNSIES